MNPLIVSLDIDCQKGFTPLCPDELPIPEGHLIVDELNAQAEFADVRIGTKDWHPNNALWIANEKHPQLTSISGQINSDIYWNAHCIAGTYGAELLDDLPKPEKYNFFVWKGMERNIHPYSVCYHDLQKKLSTGLIEWIKQEAHQTRTILIVGGLALNFCVKDTALDLIKDFRVVINLAGTRGLGDCTQAINIMKIKGVEFVNCAKDITLILNPSLRIL